MKEFDLLPVNYDASVSLLDGSLISLVYRVIRQEILKVVGGHERIINCHHLGIGVRHCRSEGESSDSSKSINSKTD